MAVYVLDARLTVLALFSRITYFPWSGHFKELKIKGNLSDCPQSLTVARLTYKQQKSVSIFVSFQDLFFSERNFCTNTSIFLKYFFANVLYFFSVNEYVKTDTPFLAL